MNSSIATKTHTVKSTVKPGSPLRVLYLWLLTFVLATGAKAGGDPYITLSGPDTVKLEQGYTYTEPGYKATSSKYGDITKDVVVTSKKIGYTTPFNNLVPGAYMFYYNVTDADNNSAATMTRVVVVTKDKTPPDLKVSGPDTTMIEVTHSPMHPVPVPKIGSAIDLVDGNLTNSVTLDSAKVQTNIIGMYIVTYSVSDLSGNTASLKRYVWVIDTIKPVIIINGKNPVILEVFNAYNDEGVTLTDNYYSSKDLAPRVIFTTNIDTSRIGTYYIEYQLTDPSGNKAVTVKRIINVVDSIKPVITLKGNTAVSIEQYYPYKDPGYDFSDNFDKNADITIDTLGDFHGTDTIGLFYLRYKATDKSGNVAYSPYRYIQVVKNSGIVHLTDTLLCKGSCITYHGKTFCPDKDTTSIAITTGDTTKTFIFRVKVTKTGTCIWPGDADGNNKVDKNDVLAIGVAYGDSGAKRQDTSLNWRPESCDDWKHKFKGGANYNNADCNGDGKIDSADMAAIKKNFGKSHSKASANGSPSDPPLSVAFSNDSAHVGDTVTATISLGSSSIPVKNAYGLAFTVSYNSKYVKPGKSMADLSSCWLGTPGKDLIYLVYDDKDNGLLNIAMTRIDHKTVSGYGQLAQLSIVMQDNLGGKTWVDRDVYMTPGDVKLIDADENDMPVYATADSMKVYQSAIKGQMLAPAIRMFPNPVTNDLYLMTGNVNITDIRIINMLGEVVYSKVNAGSGQIEIPVAALKTGTYSMIIQTKEGITARSFMKK